jgi:hypothetical protein
MKLLKSSLLLSTFIAAFIVPSFSSAKFVKCEEVLLERERTVLLNFLSGEKEFSVLSLSGPSRSEKTNFVLSAISDLTKANKLNNSEVVFLNYDFYDYSRLEDLQASLKSAKREKLLILNDFGVNDVNTQADILHLIAKHARANPQHSIKLVLVTTKGNLEVLQILAMADWRFYSPSKIAKIHLVGDSSETADVKPINTHIYKGLSERQGALLESVLLNNPNISQKIH